MSDIRPSPGDVLSQIKQDNLHAAALAARAAPELVEQLAIDAVTTDDPDLRRKVLETLHKVGWSAEPKAAQTSFQIANFSIVLDDSAVQVKPTFAPQADVIEMVPPPVRTVPAPLAMPDEEYSLLGAADD